MTGRLPTLLLCFVALVLTTGCQKPGPPLATVQGQVAIGDKPVPGGFVTFQSLDGIVNVQGEIDATGHYKIFTHDRPGIPPGKYKVSLQPPAPAYAEPPLADAGVRDPQPIDKTIPEKYYTADTSGLVEEVTLERAEYNLQLMP